MSKRTTPAAVVESSASTATSNKLTKRLYVAIASSMANLFSEGSGSAVWSILPDRAAKIFGDNASDMTSSLNSIKNAYILSCKVLESKSSFPVPLGVTINCIPNNEVTDTGQSYAFTVMPNAYNTTPFVLFEADMNSAENNQWRNCFREYNRDNLATHNVLDVQGMPYKFVHETHPIIQLLMVNKEMLGSDISTHAKIDGEWYKIGTQVLNTACGVLSSKILTKMPCQDLSQLQAQLKRADANEWTDHSNFLEESMEGGGSAFAGGESIFDKPCSFHCRLEITYELPK